jgi:heme exporter protein D
VSFDSFSAFLEMGGHALYVWLSYAVGTLLLVLNLIAPARARNRLLRELWQRQRRRSAAQDTTED